MKWLKDFSLFREAKVSFPVEAQNDLEKAIYKPTNLVTEICVAMVILNNEFLDNILDRGLKARYTENSQVFLNDLKNLVLSKNRLLLGKFVNNKCQEDTELSKINQYFDSISFDVEKDWNKLVDARILARNIQDKILGMEKLTENLIKCIYWIGPNKDKEHSEDIVIELNSGQQLSCYLNKSISNQKSSSFNTFADDLIGKGIEGLFGENYINHWDKLTQSWIKIIYENANKPIQIHIEKFIEPERIDSIGYFEYFELKHKDFRFKNIGEHIKEFDKNILNFSDLMKEIWKKREICFSDPEKVYTDWMETKILVMNSKILEHLITESLLKTSKEDITKLESGMKLAKGAVKMKLMKTLVEKMGCLERPTYYMAKKGNDYWTVPSRDFFREFYESLDIEFDYHVKMIVDEKDEENNDFVIHMKLLLDEMPLMDCDINVGFSGGEMSGKLGAKYKFTPVSNFNLIVTDKILNKNADKDI